MLIAHKTYEGGTLLPFTTAARLFDQGHLASAKFCQTLPTRLTKYNTATLCRIQKRQHENKVIGVGGWLTPVQWVFFFFSHDFSRTRITIPENVGREDMSRFCIATARMVTRLHGSGKRS